MFISNHRDIVSAAFCDEYLEKTFRACGQEFGVLSGDSNSRINQCIGPNSLDQNVSNELDSCNVIRCLAQPLFHGGSDSVELDHGYVRASTIDLTRYVC